MRQHQAHGNIAKSIVFSIHHKCTHYVVRAPEVFRDDEETLMCIDIQNVD
jgi:hypothetical protein